MKIELWMSWVGGILSTILLLVLAIFLIAWRCKHSEMFSFHLVEHAFGWFIGVLAVTICSGSIIGTAIHELYDKDNPISVEETLIYEPVSMSDVIASEGGGNLSYISIEAEQFYTFYYKYEDGYKTGKISADNAIVYQTDDIKPCIVKKTSTKACGDLLSTEYKIYIPKGSIIEKFNLDSN